MLVLVFCPKISSNKVILSWASICSINPTIFAKGPFLNSTFSPGERTLGFLKFPLSSQRSFRAKMRLFGIYSSVLGKKSSFRVEN